MLVPPILAVPALVSGLSIWHHWGPHLLLLSLAGTTALLALIVNHERALRWGIIGSVIGLITSPLLLLYAGRSGTHFAWWIAATALALALLVPLLWDTAAPARRPRPTPRQEGSRDGLTPPVPHHADR
jgi:hypothetical protein